MARILICDDESGIRAVIKRYALFEGHEVTEACNGLEAVQACHTSHNTSESGAVTPFDIIIMDIMMPEMDGISAVREIRKTSQVPVLMLSARGEEYDKVIGFEIGVDDYVVKPFSSKEIMLRVNAILRRTALHPPVSGESEAGSSTYEQGGTEGHVLFTKDGFTADFTAYKVFIDNVQIELAPKLYDLLFFLVRNKNIAIPREKILTEVWGYDYFGDDRTLDTHMKLLRKALGEYAVLIKTLRGLGYRFEG